jgi:hypothetical protein
MAQVATALMLLILIATLTGIGLLARTAVRRGGITEGEHAGRVPRSLLVILAICMAIVVVLIVTLRIAGAL